MAQDDVHEALIESSMPLLNATRNEAIADGMTDPVLFLVDCEDVLGDEMVRAWVGDDAVDSAVVLESGGREDDAATTVFARAMPWSDCVREVPEIFPYLAPIFDRKPGRDGFLVIAITDGGAAAFTVPLEN